MTRFLDIILSGAALVVLLPLLIPLVIVLRLTGEGEIFFKQNRVGVGGEEFALYKFASMLKNSPNIGTGTVTVKNDPRVLPLGHFLRKTKINELPQLFNVLIGDMSLIGPRPQTRRCFYAFPISAQSKIITVKPGLSGVGSIVFKNEFELLTTANVAEDAYDRLIMPYKGQLEEWYVDNQSLRTYLSCIFLTVTSFFYQSMSFYSLFLPGLPMPPPDLFQSGIR